MSITVNLSAEEVAQLKRATEVDDEKEAVTRAIREFLRLSSLRELKAASGKVDYVGVAEEMEALELRENRPEE